MNKIFILISSTFIILFYQVIKLNANDDTYINSSNITYNEKENIVELSENSKINFKNTNILIDKGIIDYNKNQFEVFGNFYLYEELTILSGRNLKGNTSLDIFSANNVSYIYNDDLKIDSDKLNRDKNLVYFYNNFLTPCELEGFFNCPTWSLRIDKTEYNVIEDKFTHFDTFLQIADYKVFYLPYFTHYGAKAPRKRGFLTPTIEFTVGGNQGVKLPYYVPINQSTDIILTPKIFLSESFEIMEQFHLNTIIENISVGGFTKITLDNIKHENTNDLNNSIKIETKQVISKSAILTASGLITNSVSTTRSNNDEPITFEDIYLRIENYNLLDDNDYLDFKISTIESFEIIDRNSIPFSPTLNYVNFINYDDYSLSNDLNFTILKRSESTDTNPSESLLLNLNNEITNNSNFNKIFLSNKILFSNSFSKYYFNKNNDLDHDSFKSFIIGSSEFKIDTYNFLKPRAKFIIPLQLKNSNKKINEESESITFNYQNQYAENRFSGNDLFDTSPRIVYGLENTIETDSYKFNLNINQSYESNPNSSYSYKINQQNRLSDYALEATVEMNDIMFKIDTRIDENNFSKKEMNYYLSFEKPIQINLNYNETNSEAFKDLSNDTQSIELEILNKINDNINLSYNSTFDLKNNFDPFKSVLKMSIFDECSQLDINYSNTRFNDNYNTKPQEIISLTFSMDYLGFFGYEQSTDLFLSEPGNINYGL